MNIEETVGIDMSKSFFDTVIYTGKKHKRFKNDNTGFAELISWTTRNTEFKKSNILFAFENTGLYSLPLSVFLTKEKIRYIVLPGLEIKRSLGMARGKDDRIDALAIARYAYLRRNEIVPYRLPSNDFFVLRRLLSLRCKLVKHRASYKATKTDIKIFLSKEENPAYYEIHDEMINTLNTQIKHIEREILEVIANNEKLKHQYELILSIKGVGPLTAQYMISFTNGFTLFKNVRKFASYAGIAPFPYMSGTSVKGKPRVHPFANRRIKGLLSNCALQAIRYNPQITRYYKRKTKEGKHKMLVINNIRNKILHRIFAVIKRDTPYVNTMAYIS